MIITIDGPIATGKSTIAKKLAEKLGFIFFDTGAMYRCLTYALMKADVDVEDPQALKAFLKTFQFEIRMHKGEKRYFVDSEDISDKIRGADVTAMVSKVSAIGVVRDTLIVLQREFAVGVNAVFEGRDMGTVVFPNAEIKIFLTGSAEVRAKRRYDEFKAKYPKDFQHLTLEQTIADINRRDTYDSTRELSPLIQADDAYVIDTSTLTLDDVVEKILEYKEKRPH